MRGLQHASSPRQFGERITTFRGHQDTLSVRIKTLTLLEALRGLQQDIEDMTEDYNIYCLMKTVYAEDQVEQMPTILSDYWTERLEGSTLSEMLTHGNVGYQNLNKETLIEEFEFVFGENYFWSD